MRRYLIVDDNPAFAENLAEIIRDQGSGAVVSHGGRHALELVAAERFDALVTDMRMPVMSGAALVHEMRHIDPGLPAIVVTAYTGERELATARFEGLLAVLPKPLPIPLLLELLAVARRDGLVALVEDDQALCDNLAEVLRARGFSAVMAHSVTESDRLGHVKPFAALVDLRMPDGPDGEAKRRLEKLFPKLETFVITAHPESAPSEHVFVKPFDTGLVLAALEDAWRRSR